MTNCGDGSKANKCINDAISINYFFISCKSTLRFIKLCKMKPGVYVKKNTQFEIKHF